METWFRIEKDSYCKDSYCKDSGVINEGVVFIEDEVTIDNRVASVRRIHINLIVFLEVNSESVV